MTFWTSTQVIGAAAALVTSVVLLWAGLAKIVRPRATAQSFSDLSIPLPRISARFVPLVEVAVGASCVVRPRPATAAAALLLGLFTVFLARHVRAGSNVSCGCFGSAHSAPVSWVTLVRNGALILVAISGALGSPNSLTGSSIRDLLAVAGSAVSLGTAGALMIGMLSMKQQVGSVFSQRNREAQTAT